MAYRWGWRSSSPWVRADFGHNHQFGGSNRILLDPVKLARKAVRSHNHRVGIYHATLSKALITPTYYGYRR